MSLKKRSVSNGRLYDLTRPGESIPLDTPDWVAWLENPATTGFSYPILNPARGYVEGWMTVRKERRARGRLLVGLPALPRRAAPNLPGARALCHARAAAGHRRGVAQRKCILRSNGAGRASRVLVTTAVVDRSG